MGPSPRSRDGNVVTFEKLGDGIAISETGLASNGSHSSGLNMKPVDCFVIWRPAVSCRTRCWQTTSERPIHENCPPTRSSSRVWKSLRTSPGWTQSSSKAVFPRDRSSGQSRVSRLQHPPPRQRWVSWLLRRWSAAHVTRSCRRSVFWTGSACSVAQGSFRTLTWETPRTCSQGGGRTVCFQPDTAAVVDARSESNFNFLPPASNGIHYCRAYDSNG